jgi:hypothetical protein
LPLFFLILLLGLLVNIYGRGFISESQIQPPINVNFAKIFVAETRNKQTVLRKVWGFHGGDYEEWRLLECYAVWLL